MHLEPHATLGWLLANVGGADRQLRKWCVVGAILPDIDAIAYLFGAHAYGRWHHTFGHNVFLWVAFVAWVTYRCKSKRAFILSFLAFGSHLLTDAQLSGWDQYFFWPFSRTGYLFPGAVGLEAPINTQLVYASFVVIALVAFFYQRTPLDLFSPRLDQLLISAFRAKDLTCGFCPRKCNQTCVSCQQPVCVRHGAVKKKPIRLLCPECAQSG
ncbi:MAG TPA: metal-dependent hydrolase [Verrucomicrobiae bacterium]|nr:metal-dependent hydrolase [Verrucomicrobiae bacterium]